MTNGRNQPTLSEYRALAELRYQIRRFVAFSERAARGAGIEPQQHQLLLAIKGLPEGREPSVGALAERLCVEHQTCVALVDKVVLRGFARRETSLRDRRQVLVLLTPDGEELLRGLSVMHREQFRTVGPTLVRALSDIMADANRRSRRSRRVAPTAPAPKTRRGLTG
jgi:DNA-binding MarR family transcriptional regulator